MTYSPLAKAATPLLKFHKCQQLIPDPLNYGGGVFEDGDDAVGVEWHGGEEKCGEGGFFHGLPAGRVDRSAVAAAVVVLADHDRFGAVNDGLRIVGRAHLLVGLHVDGLRPGIHDRGARIVDRGGDDIRGNGVNRRAGLLALVFMVGGG